MNKDPNAQSALVNPRLLLSIALWSAAGIFLMISGAAGNSTGSSRTNQSATISATSTVNGQWEIVPSPNTTTDASEPNFLDAIGCPSANDCWAVGHSDTCIVVDGNGVCNIHKTLTEHWDGTTWSIVPSPNPSIKANILYDVSCVSPNDCWAVGYQADPAYGFPGSETLIEHWDGSSWSVVVSPNLAEPVPYGVLQTVACASASDCWALGYGSNAVTGSADPLTLHWDGTLWSLVATTNPNPNASQFIQQVTCPSATNCWAVGQSVTSTTTDSVYQTLILKWDGMSWTQVASPNPSPTDSSFQGLACTSANDCWAVGLSYVAGEGAKTLTAHWDGSAWMIAASPNPRSQGNNLQSVTCLTSNNCWAVGSGDGGLAYTLVVHWDGSNWSVVDTPNKSWLTYLSGIACADASHCQAVGNFQDFGTNALTLAERYTVPVQLNSVVSRKVHGQAGAFDIDLANNGVECRSGGASGDYTVVFTFVNPLSHVGGASVTNGTGSVTTSQMDANDSHQYIVNLTGVTSGQTVTVNLTDVADTQGNTSASFPATMRVLVGDTNGNGVVTNADVAPTQAQVAAPVAGSNFRNDVNANGVISNGDVSVIQANVGRTLP